MKFFAAKAVSLPLVALTALLASGVPEAGAATLFELLFGNRPERRVRVAPRPHYRQDAPRRAPRAAPRITGPAYYNYRADALKLVDFAPLAAIAQSASLAAHTVRSGDGHGAGASIDTREKD